MHPVFLVPEILLIIFKFITDDSGNPSGKTLTAIARTCRSFQRPAEEIIWSKLPSITPLYSILPAQVRNKASASRLWSFNRRTVSGSDWAQFMDRASRIRVLSQKTLPSQRDELERCSAAFLAMASQRNPILLTPNLRGLEWQTTHKSISLAFNLFVSPSLHSLEIDVRLFMDGVIQVPLGETCPNLRHLKITGNGRSVASAISTVLCGLRHLETVSCSTLDEEAMVHLAGLESLSYLAVDMRWSSLNLETLRDRFSPGSFRNLQTLCWKDYDLTALGDMFLLPDVSLSKVHLEIESFCTSQSLRSFLQSFTARFPHIRAFSLVHDTGAGKRFGLQTATPGREHLLSAHDLEPLFVLKSLHTLNLTEIGALRLDDDLMRTIGSAWPDLEELNLGSDPLAVEPPSVTFYGLLSLLECCPKLRFLGPCIDAKCMLSFRDTEVRHYGLQHLRLEGNVLVWRRAEVDEMLKTVLPRLITIEESVDGITRRVRDLKTEVVGLDVARTRGGRGRRTRNSLESQST